MENWPFKRLKNLLYLKMLDPQRKYTFPQKQINPSIFVIFTEKTTMFSLAKKDHLFPTKSLISCPLRFYISTKIFSKLPKHF